MLDSDKLLQKVSSRRSETRSQAGQSDLIVGGMRDCRQALNLHSMTASDPQTKLDHVKPTTLMTGSCGVMALIQA